MKKTVKIAILKFDDI